MTLRILLALAVLAATAGAQRFELIERAVPGKLHAVHFRDLDGDGLQDLVYVALADGGREIGWFLGQARGGFAEKPSHRLPLKADVILFALADVDPLPGVEIVLFTPGSVFAYRPTVKEQRQRYRRLYRGEIFFSFADPHRLPRWPHVRDLDGDGLDDLCIPAWQGFAIRYQRRQGDSCTFEGRDFIPAWMDRGEGQTRRGGRYTMSLSFGGGSFGGANVEATPSGGYMVESVRRMSAPVFADENGDGRLDVLILEGQRLKVWRQPPAGGYSRKADLEVDMADVLAKAPRLSPHGNVEHADVDGDGLLDFLIRQEAKDDMRTRHLLFTGGVGALDRPKRILTLSGLTGRPRFRDVNGDGRPDLLIPTYRLDLLGGGRKSGVKTLDVTLHVFLSRKKTVPYGARPDYSRTATLTTDQLATTGVEPMLYLDGDFNRDKRDDLLILGRTGRLEGFLSTETRGGLFSAGGNFTFQSKPAFSVPVEVPRSIRIFDLHGDGVSEVLLLYGRKFVVGGFDLGKGRGR